MAKDETAGETAEVSEASTGTNATETAEVAETSGKPDEGSKKGWIPQSRFNEVIGQREEFKSQYEVLQGQYAERAGELGQMVDLLKSKEESSQIVDVLRTLAQHGTDEQKKVMATVDAWLQNKEPEATEEETTETPDKGKLDTKVVKDLADTKEALEQQAKDQQDELILLEARLIAEKYFDALPEQYTDQDKGAIEKLLRENVDWDGIEENPSVLSDAMAKAFESTLEEFGTPRGSVAEVEGSKETTTETKETAEEQEATPEVNWGELKDSGNKMPDGRPLLEPVQSEEDFRSELAKQLRQGRI